jgi:hypothetical protein
VRAGRDAGLDHGTAVQCVGADQVQHDPRARRHRVERRRVAELGDDRLRRGAADLAQDLPALRGIARGRRPSRALLGQICAHLAAGNPGRAEYDNVEVTLRGHARSLRPRAPSCPATRPVLG